MRSPCRDYQYVMFTVDRQGSGREDVQSKFVFWSIITFFH